VTVGQPGLNERVVAPLLGNFRVIDETVAEAFRQLE